MTWWRNQRNESAESSGKVGVGGNVETDENVGIDTFSPDSSVSANHNENPPNSHYSETRETLEIPEESQGLSEDAFWPGLSGSDGFDDSDGFNDLRWSGFNLRQLRQFWQFRRFWHFDDDEDDEIDLSGWDFERTAFPIVECRRSRLWAEWVENRRNRHTLICQK